MAVAPAQVDSGRFNVLDDDLSDTDVDEGGVEALSLPAVDESSNSERVPSEVSRCLMQKVSQWPACGGVPTQ